MGLFDKLLGKKPKNSAIENIVASSNSKERAESKANPVNQKSPVKEPETAKRPASKWNDLEYLKRLNVALKDNPGKSAIQVISDTEQELADKRVQEAKKKPEPDSAPVKNRTSWIDELADPNSPVHEKLKKMPEAPKKKTEPAQKADPVYCIENNRGNYFVIYKNDKEFFDGDKIAGCGEYTLAEGWRGDGEAFALFTDKKFIAVRKCEDGLEGSVVLPSGVAFVFTDADRVLIFSDSGTSIKTFGYGSAFDEARVLSDSVCAFAEDTGDYIVVKCFVLTSQSTWSKKVKYTTPEGVPGFSIDPKLRISGDVLELSVPDGSFVRFSLNGDKL